MKFLILVLLFILSDIGLASYKILNFNTMCDLCKGSNLTHYQSRLNTIREIVLKHNPDLISFQEFRSKSHLDWVLRKKSHYESISLNSFFVGYPDAAIVYNKERFHLLQSKFIWLGPDRDSINLGWKPSLPRILVYALFQDRATEKKFYFFNTHLDNRIENLNGSVKVINDIIEKIDLPVILAGDTNITLEMPQYQTLKKYLNSAIDSKAIDFSTSEKMQSPRDACYLKKGKFYPNCVVEHLFVSKKHNWNVESLLIDISKTRRGLFPSDHRAFIYSVKTK